MLVIEPRNQLKQELFGCGTPAVVQRRAEPITKALRHSKMPACLPVGVGKQQFDADFGLSQVLRPNGVSDRHNVRDACLDLVQPFPSIYLHFPRLRVTEGSVFNHTPSQTRGLYDGGLLVVVQLHCEETAMRAAEASTGAPNASPNIVDRFDPFSAGYLADPYPTFADARAAAPAFHSADLDYWVVTRYADVRHVLRTTAEFSAINALEPLSKLCPHAASILKDGGYAATPALTNADPPSHARQRRLANAAFTPKRVAALEPFIRDLAQRFCDQRLGGSHADMIGDFAWAFPALVLFRVLGLPETDLRRVKEGAHYRGVVIYGRASEDEQAGAARELASFWQYAAAMVEARTKSPGDDFVSALVEARDVDGANDALTPPEATSIMLQMLFAGHETTTNLLGNSFHRLLADRASWEAICRDPGLIPNAIEEVLRFDSSVIAWRHKAKQAVDIGGVHVPAQAKLLLLLGSANRDPAVFADPDRFDIRRPNAREHVSFGYGVHNCLGAPLARLEARVVLEEVSRRLPTLRLADNATLEFPANISMRGPRSLQVAW
jgi:cytochrome P450